MWYKLDFLSIIYMRLMLQLVQYMWYYDNVHVIPYERRLLEVYTGRS
jgi:hypothetical protein